MPDGSFPSEASRSSAGREDPHAYASRRRRPLIGGFEEPREKSGNRVGPDESVHTFGERHRPVRGMVDRWEVRDMSERWLGWARDLSSLMNKARTQGQSGFTDQLWQSYAHAFPRAEQLAFTGPEQATWDESLVAFFYSNPVLHRVRHALDAVQNHRFDSDQGDRLELFHRQLEDLKHHLGALEAASF